MPATDEPKGEGMTDQRPANDTLRSRVMSRIVAALTRLDERSDRVVDWLTGLDQRYRRWLNEGLRRVECTDCGDTGFVKRPGFRGPCEGCQ